MRLEGTLTSWNDERGFGRIESTQGGEPIFVHVSAWPRGGTRPRVNQAVTFEVEVGPKGKRARNVQLMQTRRPPRPSRPSERAGRAQWGTATLLAIPAFLLLYLAVAVLWKLPVWVAGLYVVMSGITYIAYAADKSAAATGDRRTPEAQLHLLALMGGWPGALLAQQFVRHKSTKSEFRQMFWSTVLLNQAGLVLLASPLRQLLL